MVPMGANPNDAVLRQIVESLAYGYERSDIREAASPRFELDGLRAAARELLRRADVASRATRAARHEEELRAPGGPTEKKRAGARRLLEEVGVALTARGDPGPLTPH
jgi:hypothetical protein